MRQTVHHIVVTRQVVVLAPLQRGRHLSEDGALVELACVAPLLGHHDTPFAQEVKVTRQLNAHQKL